MIYLIFFALLIPIIGVKLDLIACEDERVLINVAKLVCQHYNDSKTQILTSCKKAKRRAVMITENYFFHSYSSFC